MSNTTCLSDYKRCSIRFSRPDPVFCNTALSGSYREGGKKRLLPTLQVFKQRNSSVSIVNSYGMEGPGIESRWGVEIFRNRPDRPWGPPSLLYNGYRVFPGGKTAEASR
jgi:hypothetical protein